MPLSRFLSRFPGKATHFKHGMSTACGIAGTVLKTDLLIDVDCIRCRNTEVFRRMLKAAHDQAHT